MQASNPCECREYRELRSNKAQIRLEKTQRVDVSFVSNVSKYSRNSRNSQEYSHPENNLVSTQQQEKMVHSQYSHCFRELLVSKVIV
jgi:hypothetical protein